MSNDYLDTVYDNLAKVRDVSYLLQNLSTAFYTTGNRVLAEQLYSMAKGLQEAQEGIGLAVSRNLTDRLRQAEQNSVNVLEAALAATKLERES